jgi:ubiquinone biosynthesis protein UbiJ
MRIPSAPLISALNHLVTAAEWARLKLEPFAGQTLLLEIPSTEPEGKSPSAGPGPGLRLGVVVTETGLFALREDMGEATDVCIRFSPATPFLMLAGMRRVFQEARVEGSVEFAETLGFVFRNLDWDVEADLAALIGDIPAHRLTRLGRVLGERLRQRGENLREKAREFLLHEAGMLVTPQDFSHFTHALHAFQEDLAALEKRVSVRGH